jgi:hypothetical protein
MRRLVIEFSVEQGGPRSQVVPGPPADLLAKIKSFETLNVLRLAPGEFAVVARVELNDLSFKVEELFPVEGLENSKLETELLEKESDTSERSPQPGSSREERVDAVSSDALRVQREEATSIIHRQFFPDKAIPCSPLEGIQDQVQDRLAHGCKVSPKLAHRSIDGQAAQGSRHCVQTRIL